jgi:predicted SAM-dependent methyltransferase
MNTLELEQDVAVCPVPTKQFLSEQESNSASFAKAVGENALLQAEVNRQMAFRIVQMREEISAGKTEIASLRRQVDDLIRGMGQAFALSHSQSTQPNGTNHSLPVATSKVALVPRLLSPEKLLRMPALRLNLGCGTKPVTEYLNIDERELDGVDLIADVRSIPFPAGTVAEIYAAHLIEHFTEPDLKSNVLPAWRALLGPGGVLRVVTPDAVGMLEAFTRGDYPFESLRTVTYGGQDYPGNFHYTMFSRESLRTILHDAGFIADEYIALARPNGLCLEMELKAVKRN